MVFDVASGDTVEATVDSTTLTFEPAEWDQEKTVVVTGEDDDLIDGARRRTVTVSVADGSDAAFVDLADDTAEVTTHGQRQRRVRWWIRRALTVSEDDVRRARSRWCWTRSLTSSVVFDGGERGHDRGDGEPGDADVRAGGRLGPAADGGGDGRGRRSHRRGSDDAGDGVG
ncbi:MAG: hypothetical protein U5R14_05910 [Gemmatimonadota bacterium]|nr:hypothetical protein [Gemmatimonadota bacterium]